MAVFFSVAPHDRSLSDQSNLLTITRLTPENETHAFSREPLNTHHVMHKHTPIASPIHLHGYREYLFQSDRRRTVIGHVDTVALSESSATTFREENTSDPIGSILESDGATDPVPSVCRGRATKFGATPARFVCICRDIDRCRCVHASEEKRCSRYI